MISVQVTAALQTYCQQELSNIHTQVHVAQQLQTLDMSLKTPIYHALLSRDVLASVSLRTMGEYKLGWLKGVAHPADAQVSAMQVFSSAPAPFIDFAGSSPRMTKMLSTHTDYKVLLSAFAQQRVQMRPFCAATK